MLRITTLFLALIIYSSSNAQLFDTTGLGQWPVLTNSYSTWLQGAFDTHRDANNPADFGWGEYNVTSHFIEGDSIYILKTVQGNYKAISIDNLISGVYTVSISDLDGGNKQTKTFDRSNYNTKNFFFYSIDNDMVKDLEPATDSWDLVFTKFLISFPGFGSYGVSGALHNNEVQTSQVEKNRGAAATINDTTQFPFSSDISTIGYDWKTSGPNGTVINDTLTYYIKDQIGNVNELQLTGYGGSGNGNMSFEVNGQKDSLSLGVGNVNQAYYSLQNQSVVSVNTDNDWDVAFYAQSDFSAIPVRVNDINGVELYVYPKSDIFYWGSVGLAESAVQLISVYPNPASQELNLALMAESSEELQVNLFNSAGQQVLTIQPAVTTGMQNLKIPVSNLDRGVYILEVISSSFRANSRVVIAN